MAAERRCVCPADAAGTDRHPRAFIPVGGLPARGRGAAAAHNGSLVWPGWRLSYTFCCFKQKRHYLPHPFQREVVFFPHLILQSILFCADVGGRILEAFLANEQVCLSNKNKQAAKCAGDTGLKIAQDRGQLTRIRDLAFVSGRTSSSLRVGI